MEKQKHQRTKNEVVDRILKQEFIHETTDYIYIPNKENTYCACIYCKGGLMKEDIKHFKIFVGNNEYYLHIDTKNNQFDLLLS